MPNCARLTTQATLEGPVALWIVKIRGNAEAESDTATRLSHQSRSQRPRSFWLATGIRDPWGRGC